MRKRFVILGIMFLAAGCGIGQQNSPQNSSGQSSDQSSNSSQSGTVWTTYNNAQYGFQVDYPKLNSSDTIESTDEQIFGADGTLINFVDQGYQNFRFEIIPNQNQLSIHDWFEQNVDEKGTLLANKVFKPQKVDDAAEALVYTGQPIPSDYDLPLNNFAFLVSPDKHLIVIYSINGQDNNLDIYGFSTANGGSGSAKLGNRMVNSFKFGN